MASDLSSMQFNWLCSLSQLCWPWGWGAPIALFWSSSNQLSYKVHVLPSSCTKRDRINKKRLHFSKVILWSFFELNSLMMCCLKWLQIRNQPHFTPTPWTKNFSHTTPMMAKRTAANSGVVDGALTLAVQGNLVFQWQVSMMVAAQGNLAFGVLLWLQPVFDWCVWSKVTAWDDNVQSRFSFPGIFLLVW